MIERLKSAAILGLALGLATVRLAMLLRLL